MNILNKKETELVNSLRKSETPNILKTNFGTVCALFDGEKFEYILRVSLSRLAEFDNGLFFLDTSDKKRVRYCFYSEIEETFFRAYKELKKANYSAWLQGSYIWVDTNGKKDNDLSNIGLSRCNKSDSPNYGLYYFSQFGKKLYNTGQTRQTIVRKIHRV